MSLGLGVIFTRCNGVVRFLNLSPPCFQDLALQEQKAAQAKAKEGTPIIVLADQKTPIIVCNQLRAQPPDPKATSRQGCLDGEKLVRDADVKPGDLLEGNKVQVNCCVKTSGDECPPGKKLTKDSAGKPMPMGNSNSNSANTFLGGNSNTVDASVATCLL